MKALAWFSCGANSAIAAKLAYAGKRRTDQPQGPKQRWEKVLNK